MKREADLFELYGKEWEPLIQLLSIKYEFRLVNLLAVFNISYNYNCILSLDRKIDQSILDYGGFRIDDNDGLRIAIHEKTILFGERDLLIYLQE